MRANENHPNKHVHNWLIYRSADKLLEKCSIYIKGNLYDLGCGEAPYKKYFLQYADNYIGVDWGGTLHQSQADVISDLNKKIDLENECADTLVSISVMEHLNEPQQFINEAFRVLKKDGYFILQVPWQWHIHEAPHDYFRYTPYGLKYLFTKAGFKEIDVKPQSGFFTTIALKFNYFTVRLIYKLPKILMYPLAACFLPFWTLGQITAPLLDRLDKNWENETTGYFVVARK